MREHVQGGGAANTFELNPKEIQAQTRTCPTQTLKLSSDVILNLKKQKELPVLLMESEILLDSRMPMQLLRAWTQNSKTVKEVTRILMNFEAEDESQRILRDEVKGRRVKQDKDHSANLTLNKDNNNNKPRVYPAGSCSIHPTATNHDNKTCFGKRGQTTKYVGLPCEYCMQDSGRALAITHGDSTCRRNPQGPAFKPWKVSGANLTDTEPPQTGVSQDQMEEMIAGNNTKLVKSFMTSLDKRYGKKKSRRRGVKMMNE